MKKRYLILIAAIVVCAGLFLWFWNADICLGRLETRTPEQWSQLHLYMNEEITVDFPVEGSNREVLFQYETGRGSFEAEITDAQGKVLYSGTTSDTGSISVRTGSDLKLRIRGNHHGGVFSLLRREKPAYFLGDNALTYGLRVDGTHTGGQFSATYDLRKADGKYVNFYVENHGNSPVVISINGEYDRTIEPGNSGHICAPISVSIMPQPMTLKCTSTTGEDMEIYWKIAQRIKNTA